MGCCNAKAKQPARGGNKPEQMRKDKYGRPMHRARGQIFKQENVVYSDMKAMVELACHEPSKFIEIAAKAQILDFSKYVGYDLAQERDVILQSSRRILSTTDWNPLTFALLTHETTELRDHILYKCHFNVPQLLAIGLPEVTSSNFRAWSEEELTDGQIKTLLLLVENRSENFEFILNKFHHFLSDKLLRKLIPRVA